MKPGHGIKPFTTTRIPLRHIFLSAASRLEGDRYGHTEVWRCATLYHLEYRAGTWQCPDAQGFDADSTLWGSVSHRAKRQGMTYLWVYDLSWTGRITGMFDLLPRLGWRLDALSLNPGAPWLVWRRKGATLKVVDVLSVWPHSLDRIGQWWGLGREARPDEDAPFLQWLSVCRRDTHIIATAVTDYIDWIAREDLGPLSVTGNGQAWAAFRRRFLDHGILVHDDKELLAMERRAMWTGRCEAYWHGALLRQVVDEWDFSSAHTHIAALESVPTFPAMEIDPKRPITESLGTKGYALLAEVDIDADSPIVPTLLDGGIVWATGTFTTTLWEPELQQASDAGHIVRVRRGWLYRRAPALRGFASWILAKLASSDDDCPAWQKDVAKRWGNVFVGRFAMQYPKWEKLGQSTAIDVYCVPCLDNDTGEETLLMQVGHDLWHQIGLTQPNNSAPCVTGYVMSCMRAKLWDLMKALPDQALLYVDTDSILLTDKHRRTMNALLDTPPFKGLRLKRSWDGFGIYGPRQLVTGAQVRMAGIPKAATRIDRHKFEGETTESIPQAFASRVTNMVRITPHTWTVEGIDNRRVGDRIGWTQAIHLTREDTVDDGPC